MAAETTAGDCRFITGATASGKTAVGVALARRLNAEIISMDSMAVYRGMDIGTAKPTVAERDGVPHHLIDVASPAEEYSIAEYVAAAELAVSEIAARGRPAIFVGGTPLYLKALLRGIDTGPPADWPLRERLVEEERLAGPGTLHARLAAVDPEAAARLHPADTRRIVRALEVFEQTGRPISGQQTHFNAGRSAEACRVFVLDWPRAELYERINRRVDLMFAEGLVDEVRRLVGTNEGGEAGFQSLSRTASQAVGYREALEVIAERLKLADAIEQTKTRTRQFAKRQLTWFRSLSECRFVPLEGDFDPERVGTSLLA